MQFPVYTLFAHFIHNLLTCDRFRLIIFVMIENFIILTKRGTHYGSFTYNPLRQSIL